MTPSTLWGLHNRKAITTIWYEILCRTKTLILSHHAYIMSNEDESKVKYIRTYRLEYDLADSEEKMPTPSTRRLNTLLSEKGLFSRAPWNYSEIDLEDYGRNDTVVESESFALEVDGIERMKSNQAMKIDDVVAVLHELADEDLLTADFSKVTSSTSKTVSEEKRPKGELLVLHPDMDSVFGQVIDLCHNTHKLDERLVSTVGKNPFIQSSLVEVVCKFEVNMWRHAVLTFTIVTRSGTGNDLFDKDTIEGHLVYVPMRLIQHMQTCVEDSLRAIGKHDVENPTLHCHYDTVTDTRTECSPDILALMRESPTQT